MIEPSDEIVSTINSAGWSAASIALRTAAMGLTQPVDVSLWTTHTARMRCAVSRRKASSIAMGSAPRRQSVSRIIGASPSLVAISFQSVANQPVRTINTASPGDSVLTKAASHAPVPEAG